MAESDDDREAERAAILRRRAGLMACAVVAGVALPECSSSCLSVAPPNMGGSSTDVGGLSGAEPCLSAGAPALANGGQAGQAFCLTIAETAGAPAATAGGEGGGPRLCLSLK